MILFRDEHVEPILAGRKTQTRRLWKHLRVKVGGKHKLYTEMPVRGGKPFATVEITDIDYAPLLTVSQEDARAEGYGSPEEFLAAFYWINRPDCPENPWVWVVTFRLVEAAG